MPTACQLLTTEEHQRLDERRRRQGLTMLQAFGAGTMFFCPWMFHPGQPDADRMLAGVRETLAAGARTYLSAHYWLTWAPKRPPLQVVCPNGSMWVIDARSDGGDGWVVTGEPPKITAHPSIVVPGYHGFLRDGIFTDDIEGRGQTGKLL